MRQRIQRIVEVVEEKGEYGSCNCGGIIRFYSDAGVKCSSCNKLFGVWTGRRSSSVPKDQMNTSWK